MEYLEKIKAYLSTIKNLFFFIVVFVLLIVIYFKNNKISNLSEALTDKPKVEFVYPDPIINTIKGDSIPYAVEVETIKWKEIEVPVEVEKPIDLTIEDSASISKAYNRLYTDYSNIRSYEKVFMDDSTAYIKVYEQVQYNKLLNNKIEFERRYPTTRITTVKQDKVFSIVGGIDASIGSNYNSLSLGIGAVTHKNSVYIFRYDPVNKAYGCSFYLPIFNF